MNKQFLQSDEAKHISEAAKAKAWKDFKREYPFADLSKFEAQVNFNEKHATAEIYLKAGPGFWQSVSGSDRRYWSDKMKSALGIGGFPVELILNDHPLLHVPALQFEKNPAGISKLFNQKINIFVSPTEYFVTKFRDIFSKTQITHTTGKESRSWLSGPKMKYWPQQLNFALWCATTGRSILSFSRLFYRQKDSLRDGRNSEFQCSSRRSNIQSDRKQIRLTVFQKDLR